MSSSSRVVDKGLWGQKSMKVAIFLPSSSPSHLLSLCSIEEKKSTWGDLTNPSHAHTLTHTHTNTHTHTHTHTRRDIHPHPEKRLYGTDCCFSVQLVFRVWAGCFYPSCTATSRRRRSIGTSVEHEEWLLLHFPRLRHRSVFICLICLEWLSCFFPSSPSPRSRL